MRAWTLSEPVGTAGLALTELPDPSPGPRDVVVRTKAVSLNFRDHLLINGRYLRTIPPGTVPCSDMAGEVISIGSDVTSVRVGARVTSTFAPLWQDGRYSLQAAQSALGAGTTPGMLADTVVLPEYGVIAAPTTLTDEEASTLPCAALTAWHALFEEDVPRPDRTLLTQGSGGVSVFALQFAVHAGLRVIATSSRDDRLERLRALGAAETINYTTEEAWGERARSLTSGVGVDQVLDVGGQATIEQSIKAVRFGGTITAIGSLSQNAQVQVTSLFMRSIRLQGIMVGSRAMFQRMNDVFESSAVRPVIDRVFPFDRAPDAFQHLSSQSHLGKVVIRIP